MNDVQMKLECLRERLRRLARAIESREGPTWALSSLHRRAGIRHLRADIAGCLSAIDHVRFGPPGHGSEEARRIA